MFMRFLVYWFFLALVNVQAPPSYGSGRYGFVVFGAQESVLARQLLCGDASRLFLDYLSKHLSSVLGRTELCHDVWNLGPQKPHITCNENHHLALFEMYPCEGCASRQARDRKINRCKPL